MNGWGPHWPTVVISVVSVFMVTFAKGLAEQLVKRIFKRKKDSDDEQG